MTPTLRVHEVGDRDGVATLNTRNVGSESVISCVLGARSTHVLLAEALEVILNGVHSLSRVRYRQRSAQATWGQSYQLVSKRNLVELHLVNASLGRAQKRGSGKKSALHDGQSDRECDRDVC